MYKVYCPQHLITTFKKLAKQSFPYETFAYIYGDVELDHVYMEGLWIPDDLEDYCTTGAVYVQPHWHEEAEEYAKDQGCILVADIHSHPYRSIEIPKGCYPDMAQSEADISRRGFTWNQISGICRIIEFKSGLLRSNVKFWGPTVPLDVSIVRNLPSDINNNE